MHQLRNPTAEAEAAANEIVAKGGRVIAIQADVADPDAVAQMVARTEAELGPISILVNNAAISLPATLEDYAPRRSYMEHAKLGRTGLEVSRICLGCMSYGVPDRGNHAWSIDEADSRPFIKRALEGGINFFDTANRYSLGSSEEILGRAIKDFARRDEVVIATKVYGRMRPGPNGGGLSRNAIMREIDDSLRRLGTDYVDLYQIHRWDYDTPIEATRCRSPPRGSLGHQLPEARY